MSNIPEEIAPVYKRLQNELVWMHAAWMLHGQLYSHSERRIDLLNESASIFFRIVQDMFIRDIAISLSKITDPARSNKKYENLSLRYLHELVMKNSTLGRIHQDLEEIISIIDKESKNIRANRNKILAHLDLRTAMSVDKDRAPPFSKHNIEHCLKLCRDYMNAIEGECNDSELFYERFGGPGNGDDLAYLLKTAAAYDKLLRERKISWDHLEKSEWGDA